MSKKYFNIGAGWVREKQNGEEYISCKANSLANDKGNVKLQAINEDGETVSIDSFVMFYNSDKKNDSHPDVRFVFSIDT